MRKNSRALFAAVAAGVIALSGCGGSGSGGGKSGGPAGDPDTPGTQINAQPRDKVEEGGTLTIAVGEELPPNWNTMHLNGNGVDTNNIMGAVLPGNWDYDNTGKYTPNPNYLKDFKEEGEGADFKVTLHLNPDAKWNDGTPITWEDYEATWKACNGENTTEDDEATTEGFVCATTDGYSTIEKVSKGADEFEVVVDFKDSYPDWAAPLSGAMKKESVETPEVFNTGWVGDMPKNEWLAGPFKFDKVDTAQKRIYLVPNENWWGEKPKLEHLNFYGLASDATGNAFANKEVDVVQYIIDAPTYQTVSQRQDGEVRQGIGRQWRHFTVNSRKGALADQKVRQALAMGLDRATLAKSALSGLPVKPEDVVLGNHFFMPGQEGYVDNSKDTTPYDPEKAGKLLDEAGWKLEEGKDFRTNDKGEELTVTYSVITGISTSENEGKILQDQMKKIGMNVKMRQVSAAEFFPSLDKGDFEIAAFTWQGTQFPMNNINQIYGTDTGNRTGLEIPKVLELIPQIAKELDHQKRIDLTNEADKAIWEAVHTIPNYQRMELTAVPKNLANYGAFGMASGHWEDVGFTK